MTAAMTSMFVGKPFKEINKILKIDTKIISNNLSKNLVLIGKSLVN